MGGYYWLKGANRNIEFDYLVGKTIKKIVGLDVGSEDVKFVLDNGETLVMYYEHDCCASCSILELSGDVEDLLNTPIVVAEERSNVDRPAANAGDKYEDESFTWTFYTIRTIKGTVDIRWYGNSNGYYSESTTLVLLPAKEGA